jgi:hypothetical protein
MTTHKLLLAILVVGLVSVPGARAYAQRGVSSRGPTAPRATRYRPARPTMSPYLNLLRDNSSTLQNYYSFVRPEQRQRAINREGQATVRQQANALRMVQNDVQLGQAPIRTTGKGGGHMTGGSRFMTSSRFFGGGQ